MESPTLTFGRKRGHRYPSGRFWEQCRSFRKCPGILYPILSRVIILNPRIAKRKLAFVLQERRYRTAASVMLYNHDMKGARRYFEAALKGASNDAARERLTKILKILPTVAKTAQRTWRIAGRYKKEKKRELQWRRR